MSAQYNIKRTTGVYGAGTVIGVAEITNRPQLSHPKNCKDECPYGHDREFCFPCYKKLMESLSHKKKG